MHAQRILALASSVRQGDGEGLTGGGVRSHFQLPQGRGRLLGTHNSRSPLQQASCHTNLLQHLQNISWQGPWPSLLPPPPPPLPPLLLLLSSAGLLPGTGHPPGAQHGWGHQGELDGLGLLRNCREGGGHLVMCGEGYELSGGGLTRVETGAL